ncbi:MAG: FecR family protein [Acidobacteriia bacterium]|nr:FecR family protein [Terriglobia bacterium]
MSDYLWDRSGPPDPEVERLEQTLAPLRYRHRADLVRDARQRPRIWWATAAAAILAAVAAWQLRAPLPSQATAWQVASFEGAARLGSQDAAVSMAVNAGQLLRTGRDSQVSLQADDIGKIDLGPDSELRASTNRQVMLNRGMLHAFIWARPGQFVVETPSARAIDLGCEYTINVDGSGNGLLKVSLGWVAFQYQGHESFIPAGAECVTRKRQGPGIPFYEDAPEPLQRGVSIFEAGDPTTALNRILDSARPRDALTLWHLLTRVPASDRARVFDRFAQLVTLPPEVSREAVVRRDPQSIDRCWDALNLENTEWWRGWERKW